MNTATTPSAPKEIKPNSLFGEVARFAFKTLIILIALLVFLSLLVEELPDMRKFSEKMKNSVRKEEVQLRVRGFFTSNPQVHWNISVIEEKKGNLNAAVMEIELAIGLLEMHQASKDVVQRYKTRLETLKKASAQQPSKK